MARQEDICEVPGCTNDVKNKKWQRCGACMSAVYYWEKRERLEQGSLIARQAKLKFWNSRLDWLFEDAPVETKRTPKRKTRSKR